MAIGGVQTQKIKALKIYLVNFMIAQKNLINQKLITLVSNFFLSSLLIVIYTMPVFSGDSDFEKIKRSAEAGISKSQFELGTIYLEEVWCKKKYGGSSKVGTSCCINRRS